MKRVTHKSKLIILSRSRASGNYTQEIKDAMGHKLASTTDHCPHSFEDEVKEEIAQKLLTFKENK